LPVRDPNSPVFHGNQVKTCGACHEDLEKTFLDSVHGKALTKMGLVVGPVCADCHGAHGIYRKIEPRSTLNIANVADTCGKCHRGIKEKLLTSVHASGGTLGGNAKDTAPGGKTTRLPSCTSCHVGHEILAGESVAFREAMPGRCGNCHAAMSSSYALSIHGQLTGLGYGPAAKCSDCHGSHDILPLGDPNSKLSAANRVQTCAHCHANARASFVSFHPHVDPYNRAKFPMVYGVQMTLLTLLFTTFAFFGLHCLLWFIRGVVEYLRQPRPRGLRPGETAYVRFVSFHRIGHTIMMGSFLGLAATGLPLKYSEAPWAKSLARVLGGFESTGFWHRFFGVVLLICLAVYTARLVRLLILGRREGHTLGSLVFGPDSPVPNMRDLKDFLKMVRWFFGLGPKPGLERWSYWEKVDFWGAIADTIIIGFTGLILWFPNFFCLFMPGTAINIAMVVHSTQALLATGFVFAIHFFNAHLRPDKFPGDMSVMTGLVSEEEFKDERPDYFQRLEKEGKLEAKRTISPSWFVLLSTRAFGLVALAIGLALLAGMILAALGT
jgi:cytochrome b subunit of formate dehydrogenase